MNINDWLEGNRKRQQDSFLAAFGTPKAPAKKIGRMKKSRKQKSWTRVEYEYCYSQMRRYSDSLIGLSFMGIDPKIVQAADYSYQAFNHGLSGWINRRRRERFHAIKYRIASSGEYLPF